jgi:Glycosyl transferase family 11
MSIVICDLPRAGLGNQLFPLLKAAAFARINGMPLFISGYGQLKIGPYLRREKIKRNYNGYFTFEKGILGRQVERLRLNRYRAFEPVAEPAVAPLASGEPANKKYIFSEIPHWNDHFAGLREHRDLVLPLFRELIKPALCDNAFGMERPCIGVHIRMGDFRKLQAGEQFGNAGAVRTPEAYFIDVITAIRKIAGTDLPVSVFTDGYKDELRDLLAIGNITLVEGNADMVDLLLLSRSRIIVASANSTFSYWAAFLSDAPAILHPDHIHARIRPILYEGPMDDTDTDLTHLIKSLAS